MVKKVGGTCQFQSQKIWKFYYVKTSFLTIFRCQFEALRVFFRKKVRKQTPPKMANFGGSTFFTFSQKCLFTELEPIWVWNFDASLLFRGKFFQIFAFYKRWSWDIFPSVEHRHGHFWEFFAFSALSTTHLSWQCP